MLFDTVAIPANRTRKDRNRAYRAKHPERKDATALYLNRPVIAYDGEGITLANGSHVYVMLAAMSSVDRRYRCITNPNGISTEAALEFILKVSADTPKAINIIYGGSYDFNMILGDLNRAKLERLYADNHTFWGEYGLSWYRGKNFSIRNRTTKTNVTVFDVVSFFQRTFVTACDEYLGDKFQQRELIVANKDKRSSFTLADVPEISRYNSAELVALIDLFYELRERLDKVGLRPTRWDGPGAIAASLLKKHKIKDCMEKAPYPVRLASRHAYAGGRFEVLKFGYYDRTCYEYDVNSAYPHALQTVPNLARGRWEWFGPGASRPPFSLVNVTATAHDSTLPAPLWSRRERGDVCYPLKVTSWYWAPEADAAREYAERGYGTYAEHGAWGFVEDNELDKPFAFIAELYHERMLLKAAKDGAHVGIKLGLNSLYGKLAQQLGAKLDPKTGVWHVPPYHQLEWAGWATATCRAMVLRAAMTDLSAVIAFETDALFSTRPLALNIGDGLGQWEASTFTALTYAQSGMYIATKENGGEVIKSRGIDRGTLTHSALVAAMREKLAADRYVTAKLTRFYTLGLALKQDWSQWRRWNTSPKKVTAEPCGKRIHTPCPTDDATPIGPGWHNTMCPYWDAAVSNAYPIAWEAPNPAMDDLEELRAENREAWSESD